MDRFEPRASLLNGHVMTLYSWGNPRYFPSLPEPVRRYFDVAPDARVVADCHWQARAWERPTLVALHGLNGSSDVHYMKGLAEKAFTRGMNAVLLNQRNCGDTEHLSKGLFHSGLTSDAAHVIDELLTVDRLPAIVVAGYSLGGNLALKLAGEYGAFAPPALLGVAAVSPIIEIGECVRALERPDNVIYEWNFVKDLKRRMRRKERFWPGTVDLRRVRAIRTVREFDRTFTAPHFGFSDEDDYYHRASAMRIIDRITVPTLVVTAQDDPFVPPGPFREPRMTGNPSVTTVVCEHGGHCAFIGAPAPGDDGYWAERVVVDFAAQQVNRAVPARPNR
jgi:predicted alpha/beta-fold hydrolase